MKFVPQVLELTEDCIDFGSVSLEESPEEKKFEQFLKDYALRSVRKHYVDEIRQRSDEDAIEEHRVIREDIGDLVAYSQGKAEGLIYPTHEIISGLVCEVPKKAKVTDYKPDVKITNVASNALVALNSFELGNAPVEEFVEKGVAYINAGPSFEVSTESLLTVDQVEYDAVNYYKVSGQNSRVLEAWQVKPCVAVLHDLAIMKCMEQRANAIQATSVVKEGPLVDVDTEPESEVKYKYKCCNSDNTDRVVSLGPIIGTRKNRKKIVMRRAVVHDVGINEFRNFECEVCPTCVNCNKICNRESVQVIDFVNIGDALVINPTIGNDGIIMRYGHILYRHIGRNFDELYIYNELPAGFYATKLTVIWADNFGSRGIIDNPINSHKGGYVRVTIPKLKYDARNTYIYVVWCSNSDILVYCNKLMGYVAYRFNMLHNTPKVIRGYCDHFINLHWDKNIFNGEMDEDILDGLILMWYTWIKLQCSSMVLKCEYCHNDKLFGIRCRCCVCARDYYLLRRYDVLKWFDENVDERHKVVSKFDNNRVSALIVEPDTLYNSAERIKGPNVRYNLLFRELFKSFAHQIYSADFEFLHPPHPIKKGECSRLGEFDLFKPRGSLKHYHMRPNPQELYNYKVERDKMKQ